MPVTDSPLRYPGGKSQLSPFVIELMRANDLFYGAYAEPFAGGCGIAMKLLLNGFVSQVHINDIDPAIYALWRAILKQTDQLCDRIQSAKLTIDEWHYQKAVQSRARVSNLDLGFSTLFLNRTNRSGIIRAGVIGGLAQTGAYSMACRFHKENLIKKVRRIAQHADQVTLTKLDARDFLKSVVAKLPERTLVNIDPPYYRRGPELYCSFYEHRDHVALARDVRMVKQPWMVTYDDTPEIRKLYSNYPLFTKSLKYSAQIKRVGVELLVTAPWVKMPTGSRSNRSCQTPLGTILAQPPVPAKIAA